MSMKLFSGQSNQKKKKLQCIVSSIADEILRVMCGRS